MIYEGFICERSRCQAEDSISRLRGLPWLSHAAGPWPLAPLSFQSPVYTAPSANFMLPPPRGVHFSTPHIQSENDNHFKVTIPLRTGYVKTEHAVC